MRSKPVIGVLLAVLFATACSDIAGPDRSTRQLLNELDGYLGTKGVYIANKLNQMDVLKKMSSSSPDPYRRYQIDLEIADGYFAFSFDSTRVYLKKCQDTAERLLKDTDLYNEASIKLAHLYAKAGYYLEASMLLNNQIDTLALPPRLKAEYLWTLYDFSKDLSGTSIIEDLSIPPAESFRPGLYGMLPKDSERWRSVLRDEFIDKGNLASADSISRLLLSSVMPEDRDYAVFAYFQSVIEDQKGNQSDRMSWLVRSAECDIINAVRDYASLTVVAQNILQMDVNRSFRYLRISQEDALLYNAKLRPWQISKSLMEVEGAYEKRQDLSNKTAVLSSILLAILVLALSMITWFTIVRSRKLSKTRMDLQESNMRLAAANEELAVLNKQISKADKVKEEYIISFLEGLAAEISIVRTEDNRFRNLLKQGKADQLLKELSLTGRSEKAREEFYQTFDRTFLAMYPDFVDQLNALLREDARFNLSKAGKLNTELRIFALIKLGVDDSKKIASMLDYSLSTIYNYKVSVKNNALGDRESFEERVKNIGK
ncbi:MAG: hypothetical protein IJ205_00785 [Bacteroidales bacterium]|nr:hypothetical protein [Bacteroidales bacterium]